MFDENAALLLILNRKLKEQPLVMNARNVAKLLKNLSNCEMDFFSTTALRRTEKNDLF
jgi:hypothetical protein